MKSVNALHKAEFITIREAADRSGWSPGYVRSLASCGCLDSDRSSGRIMVDAECLATLLRARAARRRRPQLRLVWSDPEL